MNRRKLKRQVLSLLQEGELPVILEKLATLDNKAVLNPLFIALCHNVEIVRWYAISCLGEVVSSIAKNNIEDARIVMRRFLWSLNDESGGIGWGAPESMAEVMCRDRKLRDEYLHMLISYMREDGEELFEDGNYLELPMLQRGLLWGVGILCRKYPELMQEQGVERDIKDYLNSPDPLVVGLSIIALRYLGVDPAVQSVQWDFDTEFSFSYYKDGHLGTVQFRELL